MGLMEITVVKTVVALALTVFANCLFGSWKAKIENKFDKQIAIKGVQKATVILIGLVTLYLAGMLMPTFAIVSMAGTQVTLDVAIEMLLTAAFAYYGALDVKKLAELLQVPVSIDAGPDDHK